ncbi:MAG: CAP domain-containing protein [Tsuneonella sp.]
MGRVAALIAGAIAITGFALLPHIVRASDSGGDFAARLLAAQNAERDSAGVARLSWSGKLAQDAQGWADRLAARGTLAHASQDERQSEGENLWMGTAGYYSAEDMIGGFAAEREKFKPGKFPAVSRTGKWEDVGHYSQLIWRDTKEVGCAVARNRENDFLVCRYWPGGNWIGVEVG